MTVGEFLASATRAFEQAGVESARLDALIILEDALGRDRAVLLAHPEAKIPSLTEVELNKKVAQRIKHMPLAYIRGKAAFYGREFVVDGRVLVPRPETEAMIDLLKCTHFPLQGALPLRFIDIGSGSGCIGITAALEVPSAKVELWDIDPDTHSVAVANAKRHGVQPQYKQADLLEHPPTQYCDAFLANLPYVPDSYPINKAATHEPRLALFAGQDGLDLYRRFWHQIDALNPAEKPLYIFTEALPRQHPALAKLAKDAGYRLAKTQDFIQAFKLL